MNFVDVVIFWVICVLHLNSTIEFALKWNVKQELPKDHLVRIKEFPNYALISHDLGHNAQTYAHPFSFLFVYFTYILPYSLLHIIVLPVLISFYFLFFLLQVVMWWLWTAAAVTASTENTLMTRILTWSITELVGWAWLMQVCFSYINDSVQMMIQIMRYMCKVELSRDIFFYVYVHILPYSLSSL